MDVPMCVRYDHCDDQGTVINCCKNFAIFSKTLMMLDNKNLILKVVGQAILAIEGLA
ncbi:hypothetical protein HPP92_016307 [Vanilla planifolia]|uniref:Uncharacterized protein n=1 Tax=Vanilla planifolia TaxID=51239 RepID=A0A835UU30_VANPL|nr:hypothetical protein HPP92_016307 [Vanilla planifolia]